MFFKNLLFTVIIVTGFFVIAELFLAVAGVQPLLLTEDPLVGFADNIPQFIKATRKGGRDVYVTPENKLMLFNFQEFPQQKGEDSYRIFCLGGSTTYGRPYRDKLSFCGWLRAYLQAADPSRNWEVVNAGGISYASYRVARVMSEVKDYQPDLFIVYTGQNEFLEQRSYGALQELPAWVINLDATLNGTRTYSAMKLAMDKIRPGANEMSIKHDELKGEVDEVLNHTMGPESYYRNDTLKQQIVMHYRLNLRRMISIADSVGADIMFVKPAINIRDMSPFKSQHRDDLELADLMQWQSLYHDAHKLHQAGKPEAALAKYRQALALDDRYAELHFRTGQALFELQRYDDSESAFRRAVEEDIAPLRILSSMQQAVAEEAGTGDIPLVDFQALMRQTYMEKYGHSVFGDEYFTDHVHSNVEGYRMLAMALFNQMIEQGTVQPDTNWNAARAESVRREVIAGIDKIDEGETYLHLGAVLKWAGKFEEAHVMLLRALEILGPGEDIHRRLASSAYSLGKLDEAFRYLSLLPPQVSVNTKLGVIMLDQGKPDEAQSYCESELEQYPEYNLPHTCIGMALEMKGQHKKAEMHFERALELAPGNPYIQLQYAKYLVGQQRYEEALNHARESLRINPAQHKAHDVIGSIMLSRGDLDLARQHITEALRLQPDDEDAMHNLRQLQSTFNNANDRRTRSPSSPSRDI